MKTQTLGFTLTVLKSHGQPFRVIVRQGNDPRELILCRTQEDVISYLEFNWPVGTQVNWRILP